MKTLLNWLVRSVLENIGLILFLQVYEKKELDQYLPITDLALVQYHLCI